MTYNEIALLSFSVFIAAIIGIIRFNKIEAVYYPFIYCMWIASVNEMLSYLLAKAGFSTNTNNNCYVLFEALLITWQFKKWEIFERSPKVYYYVLIFIVLSWSVENLGFSVIHKLTFYFRVLYSLLVILMSIHCINGEIMGYRGPFFKNAKFIICIGYLIFFTFKILTDAFWSYGIKVSDTFNNNLYIVFIWINFIVNILFGIAILWIPPKPRFLSL